MCFSHCVFKFPHKFSSGRRIMTASRFSSFKIKRKGVAQFETSRTNHVCFNTSNFECLFTSFNEDSANGSRLHS